MHEHAVTGAIEQKPIKIDDFNEEEEKEIKEWVEKRKIKRIEVAQNNELLKKNEKLRTPKKTEKEMWDRLKELNKGL